MEPTWPWIPDSVISYHTSVMKKLFSPALAAVIFLLGNSALLAKYKIKDIPVKPAKEYSAHQDFQNLVIAAYPCETEAKTLELFDTDKLHERQIMPVLIVVENNNDFAIQIHEQDIILISRDGTNFPSLPFPQVLLHINLKEPLTSYSSNPDLIVRRMVDKEMYMDFEHKAFGEKLIAPGNSDSGVVFFWLPEEGDLTGARLYLPEIFNFSDGEELMFFEFELGRAKE
ncbi:hypothetical protein MYX82_12155 [Acidobacteria bacterium AH-259-D05]|nr:hypothetical protein [Acidobacteria bacterium AH-259-D05]